MKAELPLPPGVRGVCADCKWSTPGYNFHLMCRSPKVADSSFNSVSGWVVTPVRCSLARSGECGPAGVHFESVT